MRTKAILGVVILMGAIAGLTVYLAFQFTNLAAETAYHRSIIVQTRLIRLQYLNDSPAETGYFMFNLTFKNPTAETLTLRQIWGTYSDGGFVVAEETVNAAEKITPGLSWYALRLNVTRAYNASATLGVNPIWGIRYHLKLGTTAYQMTAAIRGLPVNQTVQTTGPFQTSLDVTESTANQYVFSIVNAWAIGLEVVALWLITRGNVQEPALTVEKEKHNVMLSTIFALQGVGFLAGPQYFYWLNAVIPPAPPEFYYQSGVGALAGEILLLQIYVVGVAFLLLALGLFVRVKRVRSVALATSILLIIAFSLDVVLALQPLVSQGLITYNIVLSVLFLSVVVANGIAAYLLVRKPSVAKNHADVLPRP